MQPPRSLPSPSFPRQLAVLVSPLSCDGPEGLGQERRIWIGRKETRKLVILKLGFGTQTSPKITMLFSLPENSLKKKKKIPENLKDTISPKGHAFPLQSEPVLCLAGSSIPKEECCEGVADLSTSSTQKELIF